MALDDKVQRYIPQNNDFYRNHYHHMIMVAMGLIVILMMLAGLLIYQLSTRPLPVYTAIDPHEKTMQLTSSDEPNLSVETILRWASKAATIAYTFDFANYKEKLNDMRPYFTADGWQGFLSSAQGAIQDIVNKQLRANGVVAGTPVISNQGDLPGRGYSWRVQIPFIVTYQSDTARSNREFYVVMTIVRVPTAVNAQGIGIDQFLMYSR